MTKKSLKFLPLLGAMALLSGCGVVTHQTVHQPLTADAEDTMNPSYRWYQTAAFTPENGSAVETAIRQQVADKADLTKARELGAPNPQAAVGAVQRYQQGAVRGFGDRSLEAGGGDTN